MARQEEDDARRHLDETGTSSEISQTITGVAGGQEPSDTRLGSRFARVGCRDRRMQTAPDRPLLASAGHDGPTTPAEGRRPTACLLNSCAPVVELLRSCNFAVACILHVSCPGGTNGETQFSIRYGHARVRGGHGSVQQAQGRHADGRQPARQVRDEVRQRGTV